MNTNKDERPRRLPVIVCEMICEVRHDPSNHQAREELEESEDLEGDFGIMARCRSGTPVEEGHACWEDVVEFVYCRRVCPSVFDEYLEFKRDNKSASGLKAV